MAGNGNDRTRGKRFREQPLYPVFYMFAVMFCFTAVLIGLSRATGDRVEANRQIRFETAVVKALGIDVPPRASPAMLHKLFTENIEPPADTSGGAYRLVREGAVTAYALPFEGEGFWDDIKGVVGLEPNGSTLKGVAFYQQKETPGLGAEITTATFRDQFAGLRLQDGSRPLALIPKGRDTGRGEVHAITGATETCTRLEGILNRAVRQWQKEMQVVGRPAQVTHDDRNTSVPPTRSGGA